MSISDNREPAKPVARAGAPELAATKVTENARAQQPPGWRFEHAGRERQVPGRRWYDARREAAKGLGCSEQDCATVEGAKRANGTATGRETGGGR